MKTSLLTSRHTQFLHLTALHLAPHISASPALHDSTFLSSCQVLLSHSWQVSQYGPLLSPAMPHDGTVPGGKGAAWAAWWHSRLFCSLRRHQLITDLWSLEENRKSEVFRIWILHDQGLCQDFPHWISLAAGGHALLLCSVCRQRPTDHFAHQTELGESRSPALSFLPDELMILIRVQTACTHLSSFLGASGCIAGGMTWTLSERWHIHPAWEGWIPFDPPVSARHSYN